MNFLLDLIFIGIIGLSAYLGYKKGFINTFFSFFESLISLVFTLILVKPISEFINSNFVLSIVTKSVESKLPDVFNPSDLQEIIKGDSSFFLIFEKLGLNTNALNDYANSLVQNSAEYKHQIAEYIAAPLANIISMIVAFCVIYIVIKILLKLLAVILNLVSKLPFLNASNKLFGILFGALRGLLLAFIYVRLLVLFEPIIQNSESTFISSFSIAGTFFIKYFSQINPLNIFIKI